MDLLGRAVPTPPTGTIGVGELLVDAVTRRMWLGVPATTDPALAILVNDLIALMGEDADIRLDTAAALQAGLATKANLAHTHVAADITDFTAAVKAVMGPSSGVPSKCIIMWSGLLTDLGNEAMAGWVLCNGQNGTPDLQDKFVYGAGNVPVGWTGGARDFVATTSSGGTHSHGGATGWTAITIAQMPYHTHGVADPGHRHEVRMTTTEGSSYGARRGGDGGQPEDKATLTANYTGIAIQYTGGNEGHYHTVGPDGYHNHTINVTDGRLPPFYALAFIMKL